MHKWLLVVLVLVLLLVAVLIPVLLDRPCPVTEVAFDRIAVGAPLSEVQAILGGTEGDYSTQPTCILDPYNGGVFMKDGLLHTWWGDEGVIHVGVDAAGNILWKRFNPGSVVRVGFPGLWQWRFERWRGRLPGTRR
jgi:hypothetical protein